MLILRQMSKRAVHAAAVPYQHYNYIRPDSVFVPVGDHQLSYLNQCHTLIFHQHHRHMNIIISSHRWILRLPFTISSSSSRTTIRIRRHQLLNHHIVAALMIAMIVWWTQEVAAAAAEVFPCTLRVAQRCCDEIVVVVVHRIILVSAKGVFYRSTIPSIGIICTDLWQSRWYGWRNYKYIIIILHPSQLVCTI